MIGRMNVLPLTTREVYPTITLEVPYYYTRGILDLFARILDAFHITNAIAGRLAAQIALSTTNAQPVPIAVLRGLLSRIDECQNPTITEDFADRKVCLHESDRSSSYQTPHEVEL
jgi:hypothetical protein